MEKIMLIFRIFALVPNTHAIFDSCSTTLELPAMLAESPVTQTEIYNSQKNDNLKFHFDKFIPSDQCMCGSTEYYELVDFGPGQAKTWLEAEKQAIAKEGRLPTKEEAQSIIQQRTDETSYTDAAFQLNPTRGIGALVDYPLMWVPVNDAFNVEYVNIANGEVLNIANKQVYYAVGPCVCAPTQQNVGEFWSLSLDECQQKCDENVNECVMFLFSLIGKCILYSQDCTCLIENKQPLLLTQSAMHCVNSEFYKRLGMYPNHTVDSCQALCNSNLDCVEFAFGLANGYLNRCDLYKASCVNYFNNDGSWLFDIYTANRKDEGMQWEERFFLTSDITTSLDGVTPDEIRFPSEIDWLNYIPAGQTQTGNFRAEQRGNLYIQTSGLFTIFLSSNDGSRIYIDGSLIVDQWINQPTTEKTGTINLSIGWHNVFAEFYKSSATAQSIIMIEGPGIIKQNMRVSQYSTDKIKYRVRIQNLSSWPGKVYSQPSWWNTPGQVDSNGRYVIVILSKPYRLLKASFGCDLLSTFSITGPENIAFEDCSIRCEKMPLCNQFQYGRTGTTNAGLCHTLRQGCQSTSGDGSWDLYSYPKEQNRFSAQLQFRESDCDGAGGLIQLGPGIWPLTKCQHLCETRYSICKSIVYNERYGNCDISNEVCSYKQNLTNSGVNDGVHIIERNFGSFKKGGDCLLENTKYALKSVATNNEIKYLNIDSNFVITTDIIPDLIINKVGSRQFWKMNSSRCINSILDPLYLRILNIAEPQICTQLCDAQEGCKSIVHFHTGFQKNECRMQNYLLDLDQNTCYNANTNQFEPMENLLDLPSIDFVIEGKLKASECQWQQVRYVPQGTTWHPANDRLVGNHVYGQAYLKTNAWGIKFDQYEFSQFLFTTQDHKYWLISDKEETIGSWYDSNIYRAMIKSSESEAKKYVKWQRIETNDEDPWISINDMGFSPELMLYGGNSQTSHSDLLTSHGGMSVYISNCQIIKKNSPQISLIYECGPTSINKSDLNMDFTIWPMIQEQTYDGLNMIQFMFKGDDILKPNVKKCGTVISRKAFTSQEQQGVIIFDDEALKFKGQFSNLHSTNGQKWIKQKNKNMIGYDVITHSTIYTDKICSDVCNLQTTCVAFVFGKGLNENKCILKNMADTTLTQFDQTYDFYYKINKEADNLYSFPIQFDKLINNLQTFSFSFKQENNICRGTQKFYIQFEFLGGSKLLSPELKLTANEIPCINLNAPQIGSSINTAPYFSKGFEIVDEIQELVEYKITYNQNNPNERWMINVASLNQPIDDEENEFILQVLEKPSWIFENPIAKQIFLYPNGEVSVNGIHWIKGKLIDQQGMFTEWRMKVDCEGFPQLVEEDVYTKEHPQRDDLSLEDDEFTEINSQSDGKALEEEPENVKKNNTESTSSEDQEILEARKKINEDILKLEEMNNDDSISLIEKQALEQQIQRAQNIIDSTLAIKSFGEVVSSLFKKQKIAKQGPYSAEDKIRDPVVLTESTINSNGDLKVYYSEELYDLVRFLEMYNITLEKLNDIRFKILELNYKSFVEIDESKPESQQIKPQLKDWKFKEFQRNYMIIKLDISNSIYVSTGQDPDLIDIIVLNERFFMATLDRFTMIQNYTLYRQQVPPQASSNEMFKELELTAERVEDSMMVTLIVPFLFMIFMSVSMGRVWSLYIMMQIVSTLTMYCDLQIPAVAMDLLVQFQKISFFNFIQEPNVKLWLKENVFGHQQKLQEIIFSQGALVVGLICFALVFAILGLAFIIKKNSDFVLSLKEKLFWSPLFRSQIQVFYPTCLSTFIFIKLALQDKKTKFEYFSTQENQVQQNNLLKGRQLGEIVIQEDYLSLIYSSEYLEKFYEWQKQMIKVGIPVHFLKISTIIGLPLFAFIYLYLNQASLDNPTFRLKFETLYANLNTGKKSVYLNTFFFGLRRIVLGFASIFLSQHLIVICYFYIYTSVCQLSFQLHFKPQLKSMMNLMDNLNELFILFTSYFIIMFSEMVSIETKQGIGYFYSKSLQAILVANFVIVMVDMVQGTNYNIKKAIYYQKWKNYNDLKIQLIQQIISEMKQQGKYSEKKLINLEKKLANQKVSKLYEIISKQQISSPAQDNFLDINIFQIDSSHTQQFTSSPLIQKINTFENQIKTQMKNTYEKRRIYEIKNLNINLILTQNFKNVKIPKHFFQSERIKVFYIHRLLQYFKSLFEKSFKKIDTKNFIKKKQKIEEKMEKLLFKNKDFVAGTDIKKSLSEISTIMKQEYKLMKFDDIYNGKHYNLPQSYHFFRIQYKEANALASEKIYFENLECLAELIGKDSANEDEMDKYVLKMGNMDPQSRKQELLRTSNQKGITRKTQQLYQILNQHLKQRNDEVKQLEEKRVINQKKFYDQTNFDNKFALDILDRLWLVKTERVVVYQ